MWKRVWMGQPQLWGQLSAAHPDLCPPCVMAHEYAVPQGARKSMAVSSVSVPAGHLSWALDCMTTSLDGPQDPGRTWQCLGATVPKGPQPSDKVYGWVRGFIPDLSFT